MHSAVNSQAEMQAESLVVPHRGVWSVVPVDGYAGPVEIVDTGISVDRLGEMATRIFGAFVKAVVDVERGLLAVDAELHADEEALLLAHGSRQADLWGINLYPAAFGSDRFLEFDSMINVRPSHGNVTRSVDDPALRERIGMVVGRLVQP